LIASLDPVDFVGNNHVYLENESITTDTKLIRFLNSIAESELSFEHNRDIAR